MICVEGVDLREFAKVAYDLSKPVGMGFTQDWEAALTDEDIDYLINERDKIVLSMDYVNGRACKIHVMRSEDDDKLYINESWFDHSDWELATLLTSIGVNLPAFLQTDD